MSDAPTLTDTLLLHNDKWLGNVTKKKKKLENPHY